MEIKMEFSIQRNALTGGTSKCCRCKRALLSGEMYLQQIIGSQRFRICLDCGSLVPEEINNTLEEVCSNENTVNA